MRDRRFARCLIALFAALPLMWAGCSEDAAEPTPETHEHNFAIELSAGHVHIFRPAELTFTVRNLDHCTDSEDVSTCEAVAGLPVTAFYRVEGSDRVREYTMADGDVVDNGDGTYTWTRTFGDLGAHVVGLRFEEDGHTYFDAFPMETSKAGGERFFCDVDGDESEDHAYQIRWSASEGHVHANGEEVTFQVEVMRSINDELNTEQPWQNNFDHLRPIELSDGAPLVELMVGEGSEAAVTDTLSATYQGRGIYEVSYAFDASVTAGEHGATCWLRVSFTDDQGCQVSGTAAEEDFHFPVAAPH